MLDLSKRIDLPDVRAVEVYGDHEQPDLFHVVPVQPTLAIDNGAPSLRVLLFRKKESDAPNAKRIITGGQLTLTTALHAPQQVISRVQALLTQKLHASATPGYGTPPPVPTLSQPGWVNGAVEVTVDDGIVLLGTPSLFAENRCALMQTLDQAHARRLHEQWSKRLPSGRIVYRMVLRVADQTQTTAHHTESGTTSSSGRLEEFQRDITTAASLTRGVPHESVASGPLWADRLDRALTEIDL